MGILSAIILENAGFSLNDLSIIQRAALKKVFMGKLDLTRISDREEDVLESLVSLGLLDMAYDLTPDGEHAAKLISQYSKKEREDLAAAKQLAAEIKPDVPSDDDYMDDDDYRFTENEKAVIKGAGLNEEEIRAVFDAERIMCKIEEAIGHDLRDMQSVKTIQGATLNNLKELVEPLEAYIKKNPGHEFIESLFNDIKDEINRRENGHEEVEEEEEYEDEYYDEPEDQFRDDVEADADALASAGYGTDEDYGMYDDPSDDGGWY